MKQLNKLKIMVIGLAFFNLGNLFGMGVQEVSIHPIWYFRNSGNKQNPSMKTQYRTITNQLGATENAKIPQKTSNTVRVATYNVHFWRNPYNSDWNNAQDLPGYVNYEVDKIIEVIKMVNADILILQEVGGGAQNKWGSIKKMLEGEYGYKYVACASTSPNGVYKEGNLYNCIYSKFPFVGKTVEKQYATNPVLTSVNAEQRSFVGARIQLPNKKEISVYSTHLEVRPIKAKSADGKGRNLTPDAARKEQMQELLEYIKANDTNPNVIIGADFNTFRKQDLEAYNIGGITLWSILEKEWPTILKETAKDVPQGMSQFVDKSPGNATSALDYIASEGYIDSFTRGKFTPPQFSTWTGTLIDFLFLSPTWNLGLKGGYVFYNWASDHIPVIVDIDPSKVIAPIKPVVTKPVVAKSPLAGAAAKKAVQQVKPKGK